MALANFNQRTVNIVRRIGVEADGIVLIVDSVQPAMPLSLTPRNCVTIAPGTAKTVAVPPVSGFKETQSSAGRIGEEDWMLWN